MISINTHNYTVEFILIIMLVTSYNKDVRIYIASYALTIS